MRRVRVSLIIMSTMVIVHGMDSTTTAVTRTEANVSPMNKCADLMGCSNSPQYPISQRSMIPSFNLDKTTESQEMEQEILSFMTTLGINHYEGINGAERSLDKASSYFTLVLSSSNKMKLASPKSLALANYYYGKMLLKGEALKYGSSKERYRVAYRHLKEAYEQGVDLQVASKALTLLSYFYYNQGGLTNDHILLDKAIAGYRLVIKDQHDQKSVLDAKLFLAQAYASGKGVNQDFDEALKYALEVANQKKYPRESYKGYLQSALLYMKDIDRDDWNADNGGYIEAYLAPPIKQNHFPDLKKKAEDLYQKLNSKLQASIYQEGLAYIRRAVPLNGYVFDFWNKLGAQGIKTLEDLKAREPGSYKFAIERAEWNFEQAAFQNHNPEARAAAIHALAWIYKQTGRETEFGEYARVQGWLEIVPKNQ